MISLDPTLIANKVRELAAADPTFIYDTPADAVCLNVPNGDLPACIVGQAITGIYPSFFEDNPELDNVSVSSILGDDHLPDVQFLEHVQQLQDRATPWLDAVNSAHEYIYN